MTKVGKRVLSTCLLKAGRQEPVADLHYGGKLEDKAQT